MIQIIIVEFFIFYQHVTLQQMVIINYLVKITMKVNKNIPIDVKREKLIFINLQNDLYFN